MSIGRHDTLYIPTSLTFVLPVTLQEKGLLSEAWRHSPDDAIHARLELLLKSFTRRFDQRELCEFIIICPDEDRQSVAGILHRVTEDPRYRIISERVVLPDVKDAPATSDSKTTGWRTQQLIKLAIAQQVLSSHYVTLDSDVYCVRNVCIASFISADGRAITNTETLEDYRRLYTDHHASREAAIKSQWYSCSSALLGYCRSSQLCERFYGETPAVLHTESVLTLITYLERRLGRPWSTVLGGLRGWTEYSLYYSFLEQTDQLFDHCALSGCNTVLDLERSVWHSTEWYRHTRRYNRHHFVPRVPPEQAGSFVVIQSWLPAESWLPREFQSTSEFYSSLASWLSEEGSEEAEQGAP